MAAQAPSVEVEPDIEASAVPCHPAFSNEFRYLPTVQYGEHPDSAYDSEVYA